MYNIGISVVLSSMIDFFLQPCLLCIDRYNDEKNQENEKKRKKNRRVNRKFIHNGNIFVYWLESTSTDSTDIAKRPNKPHTHEHNKKSLNDEEEKKKNISGTNFLKPHTVQYALMYEIMCESSLDTLG